VNPHTHTHTHTHTQDISYGPYINLKLILFDQ